MGEAVTSILIVVLSPAPSRSSSPDKSPARTLQLASPTATGSDELRLAHHARGAGRGRAPARCWPADPRWALVDGFAHRNALGSRHRDGRTSRTCLRREST